MVAISIASAAVQGLDNLTFCRLEPLVLPEPDEARGPTAISVAGAAIVLFGGATSKLTGESAAGWLRVCCENPDKALCMDGAAMRALLNDRCVV